jgi:hypothetical protein
MREHVVPAPPPTLPQLTFGRRGLREWLLLALLVVLIGAAIPAPAGIPGIVLLWLAVVAVVRRSRAEARNARATRARARRNIREAQGVARQTTDIEHERSAHELREKDRSARVAAEQQESQGRHRRECDGIDRDARMKITNLDGRLQRLTRDRDQAYATTLAGLQADHVAIRLAAVRITAASVPGVGAGLVDALRGSGIATAADFTGIRLTSTGGRYPNKAASFTLSTGRSVHVSGIGEVKAERLEAWRRRHVEAARRTQPQTLDPLRRQAITAQYATADQQLRREREAVAADAARLKQERARDFASRQAQLDAGRRQAEVDAARIGADLERRFHSAQATAAVAERSQRYAQAELETLRGVSYKSYLRLTFTGH